MTSLGLAGPERVQRSFGRGQGLGCVAALQGRTALGAVRAVEVTEVSLLDAEGFLGLEELHPSIAGLPALLHARGELMAGSFFAVEGARSAGEVGWRERIQAAVG